MTKIDYELIGRVIGNARRLIEDDIRLPDKTKIHMLLGIQLIEANLMDKLSQLDRNFDSEKCYRISWSKKL